MPAGLSNVITPVTLAVLIVIVVLLALTLIPLAAISTANFFIAVRRNLMAFASMLGGLIKRVWSRDDVQAKKREEINNAINAAIQAEQWRKAQGQQAAQATQTSASGATTIPGGQPGQGTPSANGAYNGANPAPVPAAQGTLTAQDVQQITAMVKLQYGDEPQGWINWRARAKRQAAINAEVNKIVRSRTQVQLQPLNDAEIQQIRNMVLQQYGAVETPSIGLLASAWVRRLIFLLLVIVCAGSDYVLVSTRAPILFGGGTTPPFLKALFQYLQVITGVLFVSIAALSGMLIQEHSRGLPDVVKLEPDIAPVEKKLKLILAVAMFVIDVVVVIFLTLGGIFQEYLQHQDLEVIYIVFIGTSILVAIGIFLAWPGLYQAFEGLGALLLGGATALICILLAALCSVLVALLLLLDGINSWLWSLFTGRERKQRPVQIENRDLAIVGFGSSASTSVVAICKQLKSLYGAYAWLTGIYADNASDYNKLDKQLRALKVSADYVSVDANVKIPDATAGGQDADAKGLAAANKLLANLRRFYTLKRNAVKPLLWVVDGDDIKPSYDALYALQQSVDASSANVFQSGSDAIQNIRLVILWTVPQSITDVQKLYAAKLDAWAKKSNSILATTLVVEAICPLAKTMVRQQYPLLMRSIAALLGAGAVNTRNSFATVAWQLHNAGYTFTALAAGAIGVDSAPGDFSEGMIAGSKGDINPIIASGRLTILAEGAFGKEQTLRTVDDAWPQRPTDAGKNPSDPAYQVWLKLQQEVFVNIIVPQKLQLMREFKDAVTYWLRERYSVNQEQVTFVQLTDVRDIGVDVSGAQAAYVGDLYFHFTVLRGVGTDRGRIPRQLQIPQPQQPQQPQQSWQAPANVASTNNP